MAGHAVLEAADSPEALSRLEERRVGLVIAAGTLPPEGFEGLREAMRQQPNLAGIPVMELSVSVERQRVDAGIDRTIGSGRYSDRIGRSGGATGEVAQ